VGHGLGPAVAVELGVKAAHVGLYGVGRDMQFVRDVWCPEVGRQVTLRAQFALAQRLVQRPRSSEPRRGRVSSELTLDLRDQRGVGGAMPGVALKQARRRV
jgi:hypothetical protein